MLYFSLNSVIHMSIYSDVKLDRMSPDRLLDVRVPDKGKEVGTFINDSVDTSLYMHVLM